MLCIYIYIYIYIHTHVHIYTSILEIHIGHTYTEHTHTLKQKQQRACYIWNSEYIYSLFSEIAKKYSASEVVHLIHACTCLYLNSEYGQYRIRHSRVWWIWGRAPYTCTCLYLNSEYGHHRLRHRRVCYIWGCAPCTFTCMYIVHICTSRANICMYGAHHTCTCMYIVRMYTKCAKTCIYIHMMHMYINIYVYICVNMH
jgi:hypothetical protein